MTDIYSALRSNVNLLGQLLGRTIKNHLGERFFEKIETIRQLAKSSRQGNSDDRQRLLETLQNLGDDELLPVARAFSQFLNLANVAEQFHDSLLQTGEKPGADPMVNLFEKIRGAGIDRQKVLKTISELDIELVLTAHPTEVTRRTMINKHVQLNDCLARLALQDLPPGEKWHFLNRIEQLINQAWHTREIRLQRPTPVEEAKWGFTVVEKSLWPAIPEFMRSLDRKLQESFGICLPLDAAPMRFASWMGGDRDGNPFVTSSVTREVILLSRSVALTLYMKDVKDLGAELSMSDGNAVLRKRTNGAKEPYRFALKQLWEQIEETIEFIANRLRGVHSNARELINSSEQIREPLELCFKSLHECGMGIIADGMLLDVLRRVACFGLNLTRLDIRQDAARHIQVFSELSIYLGLGDYSKWSEGEKVNFCLNELDSRRPLLPHDWNPGPEAKEVLETFKVIAEMDPTSFGIYIVSLARLPSDVLAVHLLLKECGCKFRMPVAPLFETHDDLLNSGNVIESLFSIEWYRNYIKGEQYVMIGYSDSAKDAGVIAASWAQYKAMDALAGISRRTGIRVKLFHGRGGTIGRGGGPAHQAILSQPPGSLRGGFRVTEQGEMVRFKFGLPPLAINSLKLYASAVLEANLFPPPAPKQEWCKVMDQLSDDSREHYRDVVRLNPDFVPYFRSATPEQELGKLPLGSRPTKRKPDGGVESLRAIPWIFAWTQNRLMLPAWLGTHVALEKAIAGGNENLLREMSVDWPFFRTRLEMLEMVFLKTDLWLAEYYDQKLVPRELWGLGERLRAELKASIDVVLRLSPQDGLLDDQPWLKEAIKLRKPYTDPLNLLQVELLNRSRKSPDSVHQEVNLALMVTIAGIAAGMRNTG